MTNRQWRSLYDRVAPILVIFCLLASLFASVGVYMAQDALDEARRENPVPEPPSTFCSVQP